ncbi:aminodeoxychorismate synthase component I [Salicibibacter kimchii]|uniref:Aminodeoxychorismate synthase component I n=1 Tax=Salicibibacter kimchii TaxID=2099786 RepID=A0A345BVI3_9BACI|nr:aminodeoxychorismate synthase component I [Salicibibacter kimchii]AXF54964.1 aminodeoxychorismate synthase component I [Salicibibacter kimchii]
MNHDIVIHIDFADSGPMYFQHPVSIIQTNQSEDVDTCMQKVQAAVDDGYYAAGFVSYEAADGLRPEYSVASGAEMPLLWFGIFDGPAEPPAEKVARTYHLSDWKLSTPAREYEKNVERIRLAISRGETYQVNYTTRMNAQFLGDARSLYEQMKASQQGGYSAYLHTGRHEILSVSPELFFRRTGNHLSMKPMKGTIARGTNESEDKHLYEQLRTSEKDRAENVMIVDLLRNDLGMIAETGTVTTPALFDIEAYPTVWQMTSTVEAELKKDVDGVDLFKALFPCGSITGAPKKETMKKIKELENEPRGVYCGSIGYLSPNGDSIFNVAIRTAVVDGKEQNITYGTGGGVTWDSTPRGEYEEAIVKSKVITERQHPFSLIESLRMENGHFPFLSSHQQRMQESAHYFGWPFSTEAMSETLHTYAKNHSQGYYKVRLLYEPDQGFLVEGNALQNIKESVNVELAKRTLPFDNVFSFHKTTAREAFDHLRSLSSEGVFDVLLYNDEHEILEFTIGNVVVEQNGVCTTPPVSLGLLPGVFRQHLLEQGAIQERTLSVSDLASADRIWLINSVRGWLEVKGLGK